MMINAQHISISGTKKSLPPQEFFKKRIIHRAKGLSVFIVCALFICFYFYDIENAKADALSSLKFSAVSLIPSLFPIASVGRFIALSDIIPENNFLYRFISKLFGISEIGASALVLGLFCGFPMGAYLSYSLFERDRIKKDEACLIASVANNAGASFIFGVIGGRTAYILFASQALSSLILSLFLRRKKKDKLIYDRTLSEKRKSEDIFSLFAECVVKSSLAMLSVCAFCVFFSVVSGMIKRCIQSAFVSLWLSAFLEVGNGVENALSQNGINRLLLCAFALGFSGVSVLAQSAAFFAKDKSIPILKIIVARLFHAVLNMGICAFLYTVSKYIG